MASAPHSRRVALAALRLAPPAPFIGEQHLAAIVVESGGMPVGEVGVGHGADPDRVGRIPDVEQEAVAGAGATGQADGGIEGDVVALGRTGGGVRLLGP